MACLVVCVFAVLLIGKTTTRAWRNGKCAVMCNVTHKHTLFWNCYDYVGRRPSEMMLDASNSERRQEVFFGTTYTVPHYLLTLSCKIYSDMTYTALDTLLWSFSALIICSCVQVYCKRCWIWALIDLCHVSLVSYRHGYSDMATSLPQTLECQSCAQLKVCSPLSLPCSGSTASTSPVHLTRTP